MCTTTSLLVGGLVVLWAGASGRRACQTLGRLMVVSDVLDRIERELFAFESCP